MDNTLEDILDKVYHYVIKNRLILTGGMAIDFALKYKGHKGIYEEDEEPDYDFFTYDMNMAYDLVDILSKDYNDIGVINAWHVQTLRVRFGKLVVADISYMPKVIFDIIPTINYIPNFHINKTSQTLRVIHPRFKMADIHKAFLTPTRNCPTEAVFHRFKKDMIRFNLMNEVYPDDKVVTSERIKVKLKVTHPDNEYLVTGLLAYCLIVKELEDIFKETNLCDYLPVVDLGNDQFEVEAIEETIPILVVNDVYKYIKKGSCEFKAPWLDDLIPRSVETKNIIYYEYGTSVTYHQLKNHKVINIHGVMLYFISKSFMDKSFKKSPYYQYYVSLKNIISFVQEPFRDVKISKDAPFFVNMNIFTEKEPNEYLIKIHEMHNRANRIKERPWPLPIYKPGDEKPLIKDHILLHLSGETLVDFKPYRDLLEYGDVY